MVLLELILIVGTVGAIVGGLAAAAIAIFRERPPRD